MGTMYSISLSKGKQKLPRTFKNNFLQELSQIKDAFLFHNRLHLLPFCFMDICDIGYRKQAEFA